jgi:hypothetical protein
MVITYTAIVVSTFLAIYCFECVEYKLLCDNLIVIVWIVSYLVILVLNTMYLLVNNINATKIRNNTIMFSSYVASFFWIVMANAEFKTLGMSIIKIVWYFMIGLISYIIIFSCFGLLVSALTQYFFKRIMR